MKNKKFDIDDFVDKYPTKNKAGFTQSEINDVLDNAPPLNKSKFNDALNGITGQVTDSGEFLTYHCDIKLALRCGIENRDLNSSEWD
jgi:hypothetical protein